MELYKPSVVKEILGRHNLSAKKAFGQNFLIDRNILEKIGAAAGFESGDTVLEVGPGLGTLGAFFAPLVGKWLAVEIDRELSSQLAAVEEAVPNFTVVYGDFLKLSLPDLVGEASYKFVANLPYYITTPIIQKILTSRTSWTTMVMMVQWEVAKRLSAAPGSKDYGALTVFVQYYGSVEVVTRVSRNSFYPAPDVDSAVVAIRRHLKPPVVTASEEHLFKVIRAAFHQRRKTLANSLSKAPYLEISGEQARQALNLAGIDLKARAETLSLEQFAHLAEVLYNVECR
ncbi:MAG: 16S rRNA (adenine(1518)-N(6)/adenine(1519)-N(6))-dimethyltransferase RsmA [Firmicutes bacterium]|nr:16S rRNA (adenine(1518)-N(6)/adenine(1519)-N(6))-dimethyltransferase RsmA [Bacillota bacterium]